MIAVIGTYAWHSSPSGFQSYMYVYDLVAGGNWIGNQGVPFRVHGWSGGNNMFRHGYMDFLI